MKLSQWGAAIGALGVALGAFGAHGLEARLEASGRMETWETAVFYHLVHAVVLAMLGRSGERVRGIWICFAVGVGLFSGSLYALALTDWGGFGAIAPLGGTSLIVGWIWLACWK